LNKISEIIENIKKRRKYMTSKERVRLAFQHKEADKIPISEMHIMSQVTSKILGREAITTESGWAVKKQIEMIIEGRRDEYVERKKVDTLEVYEKLDLDMINIELDPPKTTGLIYKNVTDKGWEIEDREAGTWSKFVYDEESDTELEVDSSIKQGGFKAIKKHMEVMEKRGFMVDESRFETVKYVVEKVGDKRAVMVKIPNLIPTGLSWFPLFLEMMYLEPEMTQEFCDLYLKRGLAIAEKAIELGADVLLVCSDWAFNSGPMASPGLIRKYWIPQIKAVADLCHKNGVFLVKHTDGNIMKIADDFVNMGIDGYQGIEPNAGMNLAEMKKLYGDKILFMGNVDCGRTLPFGTPEEVIEETKQCIRDGAPGGGYILSSCNTIQKSVPLENYMAMIETAHKYSKYPINV